MTHLDTASANLYNIATMSGLCSILCGLTPYVRHNSVFEMPKHVIKGPGLWLTNYGRKLRVVGWEFYVMRTERSRA